jgi:hypothetical protein
VARVIVALAVVAGGADAVVVDDARLEPPQPASTPAARQTSAIGVSFTARTVAPTLLRSAP